ncbi:MAG TPA: arsenate reductase (glutaredoxin) [Gammaproteobacteria bacterium]|nr:arsenate reductase (glutaredoxin) [Gammaproteobacteria bacterium]
MKKVTIWHNPRCSKSRETLALLRSRNIEPEILEYLQTPPAEDEIARVLDLLGIEPRELMRASESVYDQQHLDDASLGRQALIAALHRHPILIQRPVVLADDAARIGRPPEAVLEIL